jgi:mRNA interferase MazF
MEKDFIKWHELKDKLQKSKNLPYFQEREIWWCSLGANVGCEEDGKNKLFSRPILIVRKFNSSMFWGVPLTTLIKENKYYYTMKFQDKTICAMLSQLKVMDSKRLTTKMGQITDKQGVKIKEVLKEII